MKIRSLLMMTGVFLFASALLSASDWPQWRGPQRDGVSKETGLLQEWPKEGPKQLWQVKDIGYGFSTPSVVGDRLYLLGNKGADNEYVQARSVADGKEIWTARLGKVGPNPPGAQYPGAAPRQPLTATCSMRLAPTATWPASRLPTAPSSGKRAFARTSAASPAHGLMPNHRLWTAIPWSAPGGKIATIVALDKKTGKTIWQTALPEADDAAYASAIIVEIGGVKQYVHLLQKGVVGLDAKTGKYLWRYDKIGPNDPAHIATPVSRDGFVYFSLAETGGALFKVKGDKGIFSVEHIYAKLNAPSKLGGFVLLGDYLYGTKAAGLRCLEFTTGAEKWQNRCIGPASLFFADGRIYLHGENGEMALVEPTPEAYREKGRFTPPGQPDRGGAAAWAYPVVANGRLYVRDLGVLWCYDVKASSK